MKHYTRIIAMVLALAMVLSAAGCAVAPVTTPTQSDTSVQSGTPGQDGKQPTQSSGQQSGQSTEGEDAHNQDIIEPSYSNLELPAETPEREDLEQILDLVSPIPQEDVSDLSDEELADLIADILEKSDEENPNLNSDSSTSVDTEEDMIADDGSLQQPFDQIYPELMDQVEFSEDSLLVKLLNTYEGKPTAAMQDAGVAKLVYLFTVEDASWYEAKLVAGTDTDAAVDALRQLGEVMTVDYNYTARADSMGQPEVLPGNLAGNEREDEQWYLKYCGISSGLQAMDNPGGSPNVIVAVIDTGVDYNHIDLSDNIWVNKNEIPDNGIDDDNNGYVDDYYGVNLIAGYGNADDDNGHGTHVAGIIAAQNNNVGTVGIAYNVKIMAIKALNSEGITDDVSIVNAIMYAVENGAEVINMSFGQTAMSLSVQEALAMAYGQCVLVASAGNNGAPNEGQSAIPNYPAALSYVLGVMSIDQNGKESAFSNYDVTPHNNIEYQLYAPGESMLSTIPGNRYASWSGTSMAAPVVSAMAALLRSQYSDRSMYSTKFIYGQLTSTSENTAQCLEGKHKAHSAAPIANLYAAITKLPKPDVVLSSYDVFDTKGFALDTAVLNNGDGVVDAGETLALGLTLRNLWGTSSTTSVKVTAADATYVNVHNPVVDYGGIGTYATADCGKIYTGDVLTGWTDPFYITISEDCPGNYQVELTVTITSTNGLDPSDTTEYVTTGTVNLLVRNGSLLPTSISEDMTLKSGNLYVIYNATTIEEGVTVTVEPGAQIQFWSSDREDPYADQYMPSLRVYGTLLVQGTKENPVLIFPGEVMNQYGSVSDNYIVSMTTAGNGVISLVHADITNFSRNGWSEETYITYAYGCIFRTNTDYDLCFRYLSEGRVQESSATQSLGNISQMENCVFYKLGSSEVYLYGNAKGCAFVDSNMNLSSVAMQDCLLLGNAYARHYTDMDGSLYLTSSSYNASNSAIPGFDSDDVTVYYRPETGTTYFSVEPRYIDQWLLYVQELGGSYAIFEDADEQAWFRTHLPMKTTSTYGDSQVYRSYDLGIRYSFLEQRYVWSDGSSLGEFLQQAGVTDSYNGTSLYLANGAPAKSDMYMEHIRCLFEIPGEIYITDIRLNQYNILLDMASTFQMIVSTAPVTLEPEELIFESSNEEVITVDAAGVVTPVGEGEATVTVYCADRAVSNYATFYVREYRALESLSFESEMLEVAVGDTIDTKLIFEPINTTRKTVTYTSSNEEVATVDRRGRVTGKTSGTAVITATSTETAENGEGEEFISTQFTVTVYTDARTLALSTSTLLVALEDTVKAPTYTITPANAETVLSWRSTDPNVATVDAEGNLKLKSAGTTTLILTDARTGLSDSCLLIVSEEDITRVVDIQTSSSHRAALTDEGELYYWGNESQYMTPVLIAEHVSQYHMVESEIFYLTESNTLHFWYSYGSCYSVDTDGITVKAVAHNYSNELYIISDNGHVYYKDRHDPVPFQLVNLEATVTQIAVNYDYAWFLTENGELFFSTLNSSTVSGPVASGVAQLAETHSNMGTDSVTCLMTDGRTAYIYTDGAITTGVTLPGFDMLHLRCDNAYNVVYVRDGKAYQYVNYEAGYNEQALFPGMDNIVKVVSNGNNAYYAITTDGLLYGMGSNSNNAFASATTEVNVTVPVVIAMKPVANNLRLTGSNLVDGAALFEDTLELTFSNSLVSVNPRLYADGVQIPVSFTIHDENCLTLSLSSGFKKDVEYRLEFSAGDLKAVYNLSNTSTISVPFTYGLKQVKNALFVRSDDEIAAMNVLNVNDWSRLQLSWHITDESIATINEDQQLLPHAPGVTTIYMVEAITGFAFQFDVTVWEPLTEETDEEYNADAHYIEQLVALERTNLTQVVEEETEDPEAPKTYILNTNKLFLDFNKPIETVGFTLSVVWGENELQPISQELITTEIYRDFFYISLQEGFQENVTYQLDVHGMQTTGIYAAADSWTETFVFHYVAVEEEEIIDTTITREAVLDETVERFYWSAVNFAEALNQKHSELNYNYRFHNNVILNRVSTDTNPEHWLRLQAGESEGTVIPFGGNYWGTTDERAIELQIIDKTDFSTYAKLDYAPYLTEAPLTTFPFVTDLVILDKSGAEVTHLSNQEITVRVTFNRDMNTEIPLDVAFGANYPYNEYAIEGNYVDARTWEGSYLLTAILENGNHCFSIGGGRSAEGDLELYTDWGRFGFELDTASAQAMLMQAEATAQGIQLSWSQDDFDTLMGYNVYRSTGDEFAYTQRINATVIPAGTEEYLDTDVEPGVVYYYSFTVVQTDLSESNPSGKVDIMSLDTMAPDLYHTPVYNATLGANLMITATVKDNVAISGVYVYYRTVGQTAWNTAVMNHLNDKYSVLIPAEQLSTAGLEYYIEATDGVSSTFRGSASAPYQVAISAAADSSAKGDVNGDGKISSLDALMLLQQINNILYLDSQQFERADLNGNGVLEAQEALRILHYVSGKVGSLSMN